MLDIYSTENLEKQYWFLAESTTLSLDQICDIRDYLYGGDDYIIKHVSPELREVLVLNQLTKDAQKDVIWYLNLQVICYES